MARRTTCTRSWASSGRRIRLGFLAVTLGVAVTPVKIPVYDEPEGVLFLAFDAVLLAVLVLAWRSTRVVGRG